MLEYQNQENEDLETFSLNKNTFDNALKIIKKTNSIKELGQYQLNTLLNGIINQYDKENIKESKCNEIMSSTLYENFMSWFKLRNSNNELIEYMSCVKFVQIFGKKYSQSRNSKGKCWKDIAVISKFNDNVNKNSVVSIIYYMTTKPMPNYIIDSEIDVNFDKYLEKYHVAKWYSIENFTFENDQYECRLSDNIINDYYKPIKLIIDCNEKHNNLLKKFDEFVVDLNNTTVVSQPMCKYIDSSTTEIINEEYNMRIIVNIANFPFLKKSNINNTLLKITSQHFKDKHEDIQISMLIENLICDCDKREKLSQIPQIMNTCSKYQCNKISQKTSINIYEKDELKNEYIRGIFIIGCFTDNLYNLIKTVNLHANGHLVLTFNKKLIKLIGKIINEHTIYIPIGDMNIDNIHNKMSYNRLDTFNLTIEFNEELLNGHLTVYVDTFELFSYNSIKI